MAESKRYYWLKLKDDFFQSKRIKKLRKIAGGDTLTIIYLKMQLLSIKHEGVLTYTGLENTFEEELALDLDEDIENVKLCVAYLKSCGLLETSDDIDYAMPYVKDSIGSETASTQRSRECRARQKMLQCNTNATQVQQLRNVELEIEKEIDIDKELVSKQPTLTELKNYISDKKLNVDPQRFFNYYSDKGWNKITDWKAAVEFWHRNERKSKSQFLQEQKTEYDMKELEKALLEKTIKEMGTDG